jgi:hypothetical protein
MENTEILFKFYQEEWIQCRQHRDLRIKVTGVLLAVAGAITALIFFDKSITCADVIPSIILSLTGIFGAIFTMKEHERFSFHLERARAYRDELDRLLKDLNLKEIRETAGTISKGKHPILFNWKLNILWGIIHIIIFGIGICWFINH